MKKSFFTTLIFLWSAAFLSLQAQDCSAPAAPYVQWSGCNKTNADLTSANLSSANLRYANLTNANLSGANLLATNLRYANLTNANLTNARGPYAKLISANLTGANLTGVEIYLGDLTNANLSGANLFRARLTNLDMIEAKLSGANLTNATLSGANLTGVVSGGIIGTPWSLPDGWALVNGYLVGPSANLTNANLGGANLTNANLTNANLTNANLSGANLTGVVSGGIIGTPSALPVGWQLINGYLVGPLTVTFNANGGTTPSPETITVQYNATYGTLATASRPCHTFNGWFTASNGGTEITSTSTVGITSNQTLYAQWTAINYNYTETIVACGSYEWHGTTYTSSNNTATWTGQNAAGCDSIVTLNLTINQPSYTTETIVACGSSEWHGNTYTSSNNTATWTGQNAAGCDSIVTLDLTINQPSYSTEPIVACGSYEWHGNTYTSSNNTATWTGTNAAGCDSTVTLNLTINALPTLAGTLNPAAICNNTAFTYTPTSETEGATFTWTRAAQTGISNAEVTTSQTTNPNEVLVNTTAAAIDVIYAYTTLAPNGCTNTQNVTVTVNPSFSQLSTSITAVAFGKSCWGDYDNDDDLDVLVSGQKSDGSYVTEIWTNTGGVYTQLNTSITGVVNGSVEGGDYDNDGDLDVLLSGGKTDGSYVTEIWTNTGGSFSQLPTSITGAAYGRSTWGDYDNDGDLDVLLTSAGITEIWTNTGGSFSQLTTSISGGLNYGNVSVDWGDYDNDGDLDFLLSGFHSGGFFNEIWTNTGGTFSKLTTPIRSLYRGSAVWGDYDNDGDLDIVVHGYGNALDPKVNIWTNNGGGNFSRAGNYIYGVADGSVSWGDYDNDGDLDLLASGTYTGEIGSAITHINTNNGGYFSNSSIPLTGIIFGNSSWGDYDNDGDLDILLSGMNVDNQYVTEIWTNNRCTFNTAPVAPTALAATQTSCNAATLTWSKTIDTQTSQNGLAYNIRIGTAANGIQKLSPMANVTNGYRSIASIAKVQWSAGGYTVTGLTPGTYYWSVQATDAALAGGEWATEGTFTIGGPTTRTEIITACSSYEWHGTTYTSSNNTATWTGQNAAGCDSIVTLNLTINQPSYSTETITACGSYEWHGNTYTSSNNTATWTGTNAAGCDSIVTLNLTINQPSYTTETITACGSYEWHGNTYTSSNNTATWTGQNAASCDSIVTLNLTINPLPTPAISGTLAFCAGGSTTLDAGAGYSSYLWSTGASTQTISVSNTTPVSVTVTNAAGCSATSASVTPTANAVSTAPTSITSSVAFATAGVNFTLSVNGGSLGTGATWKWYTGSCGGTLIGTGASISVSQTANTIYFVRAEGTCNTTDCSTITVNSFCGATGVTSSAGTTAICAGSPVTLTVIGSVSPGAQWRWDDECDNDDDDHDCSYNSSSTFTVSPTSTKTYYVRSVGGLCGLTACVPITVNVIAKPATPGTISGSASVCASTSVTYTIAAVAGATSYTWTAPSNATLVSAQGATSMTVSYASAFASGTLKVKASNCSGASSDRTLSVSKRAVPSTPGTISGASPVCAGSTQTYSISAVTNASNYTWTLPSGMSFAAGTTTNGTSVQVVMSNTFASGTISVKANNICGVSSSARTKSITGKALPTQPSAISGATTLCNGSKLNVYSVSAASGFTFNWTVPTGATITTGQGTNSIKVTWGTTSGTVSVTKSNSCGVSAPSTKLVTSVACRLDEEVSEEPSIEAAATSSNLLVYPNPTTGNANVVFGTEIGGKYTINVLNTLGQVVYSKTASSMIGENTHAIDISELSSGLYFINLLEESGMRSLRLVKR